MFKCGTLPLRIETGRHKGKPIEDRIYIFFFYRWLNEIESEKHFLLVSPFCKEQRKILYYEIRLNVKNQIDDCDYWYCL